MVKIKRPRCPDCDRPLYRPFLSCVACGWKAPAGNDLPPHPGRVDELGLRLNAAVKARKISWSSVARTIGGPTGVLSDLLQGKAPDDPEKRVLLEAVLDDCGG